MQILTLAKSVATAVAALTLSVGSAIGAEPTPAAALLTPDNHILILVDHQPQMAFATRSIDVAALRNNVEGLAKSAAAFRVPTLLTTVAATSFAGSIFPEVQAVFPDQEPIDRSTMNAWEDGRVTDWVNTQNKPKVVISALWTEVCGIAPVLSALEQGYEVFFVTDASGGVSDEAHDMAVERMIQAGAMPITWIAYLLELQRDWARGESYAATMEIVTEHAGGYGLGAIYAGEMFAATEGN